MGEHINLTHTLNHHQIGEAMSGDDGAKVHHFPHRMRCDFLTRYLKGKVTGAEIGVAQGVNAEELLRLLDIKKLYLVDPYDVYSEGDRVIVDKDYFNVFIGARESLRHKPVSWILEESEEAVKQFEDDELDFVYIDGNHQYEFVKKDIELWTPKVKKGGVVSGHDFNRGGVKQAVTEYIKKHKIELSGEDINWFFIK